MLQIGGISQMFGGFLENRKPLAEQNLFQNLYLIMGGVN